MSPEHEAAAEISAALIALKEEFSGEPSLSESVGVIAAQMIVNGDLLKRMLAEIQALTAGIRQR